MERNDNTERSKESEGCRQNLEVPSEKEVMALKAMRAIKVRVRELKKSLSEISSSGRDEIREEVVKLEKEVAELKREWNKWEEKREKAERERMILLGHEEVS